MGASSLLDMRITGILLIAGTVTFFTGAAIVPLAGMPIEVYSAPTHEQLSIVATHQRAWQWAHVCLVVGVVLTLIGLGLFSLVLRNTGNYLLSVAGFLGFALGAALWVAALAFQGGVTAWAARELETTAASPPGYETLRRWADTLYLIYMLLAYSSIVVYGAAIRQPALLPGWLGWTSLVVGVLGLASVAMSIPGILSIPAGVHIIPAVIGIFLMLQR